MAKMAIVDFDLDAFLDSNLKSRKPNFPFSLYYSQGVKALRLRNFAKAVDYFNEALEKLPNDAKTLLNRCKARMGLLQYEQAKADAEAVLEKWPQSAEAYHLKAEAELMVLDVETSLITYTKGRKVRLQNHELVVGQRTCEEALCRTSENTLTSKDLQELKRTGQNGSCKLAKAVKSEFYNYERFSEDRKFLEDLLSDKGVKSVHGLCREGLDIIHHNMAIGAMHRPIFGRKRPPLSRKHVAKQSSVFQYVRSILRRCEDYLNREGMLGLCLSEGSRLLDIIEARKELTPDQKQQLEVDVFHILGLAHERQNRDLRCITLMEAELGLAQSCGMVMKEIRALRCLGERYFKKNMLSSAVMCSTRILSCLESKKFKRGENTPPDASAVMQEAVEWAKHLKYLIRKNIRVSIITTGEYIVNRLFKKFDFKQFLETSSSDTEFSELETNTIDTVATAGDLSSSSSSEIDENRSFIKFDFKQLLETSSSDTEFSEMETNTIDTVATAGDLYSSSTSEMDEK